MKSRCSFILKAGLALVLCFILLFSTMTAGMAALVKDLSSVGATSTTVYYAVPDSVVGSYTVKLNVNRQGDGNSWADYTMSKDGTKRFHGRPVYKCTFTDLYDGLGKLQFQLYEGDTWKSQVEPISSWTAVGNYNNKVWLHGGTSWQAYPGLEPSCSSASITSVTSATAGGVVYNGVSATISYSVTGLVTGGTVDVYDGDTKIADDVTGGSFTHTFAAAGSHTLKLEVSADGKDTDDSAEYVVTVYERPYLDYWVNANPYGGNMDYVGTADGLTTFSKSFTVESEPDPSNMCFKIYDYQAGHDYYNIAYTSSSPINSSIASGDAVSLDEGDNYSRTFISYIGAGTYTIYYVTDGSSTHKLYATCPTAMTYNVTLNAGSNGQISDDNSTLRNSTSIQVGNEIGVSIYAHPNTGYDFVNWTSTSNNVTFGSTTSANTTITASGSDTVTATFAAKTMTATLDANGGIAGTASVTATYGEGMPSITTLPYKPGHTFQGFYDAAEGGTQYYTSAGASAHTWDKTVATTLYAHWSDYIPKKDMNIYADVTRYDSLMSALYAENSTLRVVMRFSNNNGSSYYSGYTAGTNGATTEWAYALPAKDNSGQAINGLFYCPVPANGYNKVEVSVYNTSTSAIESTYSSGLKTITSAAANTFTYNNGSYDTGLHLPYNQSPTVHSDFGEIYFDNTVTKWNINETNKLYFVIGRDAAYSFIEMSPVTNAPNLYYLGNGMSAGMDWDNYTYFGFALDTTARSGSGVAETYSPDASGGYMKDSLAFTTLMSMYDLSNTPGICTKSFIGFGLSESDQPALDFLWISNNGVGSSDGSNENLYMNRPQDLYVNGRATVKVTGYTATGIGPSGVTANASPYVIESDKKYNSEATGGYLAARTSTVTLYVKSNSANYTSPTVQVDGVEISSVDLAEGDEATTYAGYTKFQYVVKGGDDQTNTGAQRVDVNFTLSGSQTITREIQTNTSGNYTNATSGGTFTIFDLNHGSELVFESASVTVDHDDALRLTATAAEGYSVAAVEYSTNGVAYTSIPTDSITNDGKRVEIIIKNEFQADADYHIRARFIKHSTVTVTLGSDDSAAIKKYFTSINSVSAGVPTAGFNVGDEVTINFAKLSEAAGIDGVTFADSKGVDPYEKHGHSISFTMPGHDVELTDISTGTFDTRILINKTEYLDVDGLSAGGYYFKGADVYTITLKGTNAYENACVLKGVNVKVGSAAEVTVGEGGVASQTFEETVGGNPCDLIVAYNSETKTVTITGHIGESLVTITPNCSKKFNINVTSKVMSDESEKFTTYYKTQTNSDGKIARNLADLKVYLYIADASVIDTKPEADELGLEWNEEEPHLTGYTVGTDTYYLLDDDVDGDYISLYDDDSKFILTSKFSVHTGENAVDFSNYYSFLGFYTGSASGPDFSGTAIPSTTSDGVVSCEFTLKESTFIYAVATRDLYLGGYSDMPSIASTESGGLGLANWNSTTKFDFDNENKVYYKTLPFTGVASGTNGSGEPNDHRFEFKFYDIANPGIDTSQAGPYNQTINQTLWDGHSHTVSYQEDYGVKMPWTHDRNAWGYSGHGRAMIYLDSSTDLSIIQQDETYGYYLVNLYYKPSTEEIYAKPVYKDNYYEVYLSNGRIDGFERLSESITGLTAEESITVGETTYNTRTNTVGDSNTESYVTYTATGATTATCSVTIAGTGAGNVYIPYFVVYDLDEKSATGNYVTKVAATPDGSVDNKYNASVSVSSNTFICPVYELKSTFLANNISSINAFKVTVDKSGIEHSSWGGMIAMYLFNTAYNGNWPGQLMLPNDDGTFYSTVYSKLSGTEVDINGILFNNYNSSSSFFGKFGNRFDYPDYAQTYDYLEPVTLMNQAIANNAKATTELTFNLKQNDDGYHGWYYNNKHNWKVAGPYFLDTSGSAQTGDGITPNKYYQTKKSTAYSYYDTSKGELSIDGVYTFTYLYDKDDEERLNLYGSSVGSATAGYYIVCVGESDYLHSPGYTPNSKPYEPNDSYNGEHSIDWYVYKADGTFLLHTLSDSLYGRAPVEGGTTSPNPYIVDQLILAGEDPNVIASSSVFISYEAPNNRDESKRFSGQWYMEDTNTLIPVRAAVGIRDSNGNIDIPDNPVYWTAFGKATVSFKPGTTSASADAVAETIGGVKGKHSGMISISEAGVSGNTILTADPSETTGSTFVGWYSYDKEKKKYVPLNVSSTTYEPNFSGDTTYYAIFSQPVSYDFTYTGRQGSRTITITDGVNNASYEEAATGKLSLTDRGDNVTSYFGDVADQVSLFNKTVAFNYANATVSDGSYKVTVPATETPQKLELNLYYRWIIGEDYGNPSGSNLIYTVENVDYSQTINITDIELPGKDEGESISVLESGKYFYGWMKYDTESNRPVGDYISTVDKFGLNLTGDMDIVPVFGSVPKAVAEANTPRWGAYVDKNAITFDNNNLGHRFYNDSIIRFTDSHNSMNKASTAYDETGVIILAQTGAAYTAGTGEDSYASKFSACNDKDTLKAYLVALHGLGDGKRSARMHGDTYGLSYAYYIKTNITGEEENLGLSNINRADICQVLDYTKFNNGQYIIASYAMKTDGDVTTYTISDPISGRYLETTEG